jgi:hypothetical protein
MVADAEWWNAGRVLFVLWRHFAFDGASFVFFVILRIKQPKQTSTAVEVFLFFSSS